jgi:hypothetical protein
MARRLPRRMMTWGSSKNESELLNNEATRGLYLVLDKPEAGTRQHLDELCVELVLRVPWPACDFDGGLQMGHHVDLAGRVL